jgi:hypothetical protein
VEVEEVKAFRTYLEHESLPVPCRRDHGEAVGKAISNKRANTIAMTSCYKSETWKILISAQSDQFALLNEKTSAPNLVNSW